MARKKLTQEQWEEIAKRYIINGESLRSIAKDYGVDHKTILNHLKSKNCKGSGKNGENDSPQNSPNRMESIQNTAIDLIEHARNRLGNESDVRVAISLAEQTVSVKGQYTQLASETLSVALQFSNWAKKNTHKVFQGDTLDVEGLKASLVVADAINKYATAGNRVYESNKPKEEDQEKQIIEIQGGFSKLTK